MELPHAVDFVIRQLLIAVSGTNVRPHPNSFFGDETRALVQRHGTHDGRNDFRMFKRIAFYCKSTGRRQVVAKSLQTIRGTFRIKSDGRRKTTPFVQSENDRSAVSIGEGGNCFCQTFGEPSSRRLDLIVLRIGSDPTHPFNRDF